MLIDLRYSLGQLRRAQNILLLSRPINSRVEDCLERACDGLERAIEAAQAAEDAELNDDLEQFAECWTVDEILRREG